MSPEVRNLKYREVIADFENIVKNLMNNSDHELVVEMNEGLSAHVLDRESREKSRLIPLITKEFFNNPEILLNSPDPVEAFRQYI